MPGTVAPVALSAAAGVAALLISRWSAASMPAAPRVFWLVVALPIFGFWALRAPFPDLGWDVLNYHVMHGERALWGPLFPPGDFYPYVFPYLNPAGDMVTAMFREVLGYRLGTIASPLALVWAGKVSWKLFSPFVKDERARAVAVLVVVAAEGALLEVSGYMVDLLALPLLLEATCLATTLDADLPPLTRRSAALGLLLGTSLALKLTNLVFALPIGLVAIVRWFGPRGASPRSAAFARALLAGMLAFAAPIAPHALLLVWKTGNPVFPYFNGVFASPYYPEWNIKDGRWGPVTTLQAAAWPLLSAFRPERLSETHTTTGRLALGWIAAFAAFVRFPRDGRLRAIAAIVVLGGVLWSLGTGYHRYGLFGELLGGILIVCLAAKLAGVASAEEGAVSPAPGRLSGAAAAFLLLAVAAQTAWGAALAARGDWSGRPTLFHAPAESAREARFLLQDRDLGSFFSFEERESFPSNAVWVDVAPKVNGFMTLLDRDAPMIGLQVEDFLASRVNQERLDAALASNRGRPAFSLAFREHADSAESKLARLGFPVKRRTPLAFPFYSTSRRIDLVLLEVALPPRLAAAAGGVAPGLFGTDPSLLGSLDGPVNGEEVRGDLLVRGWARKPGEDLLVTVLVGGAEAVPRSFRRIARPDVVAVFPQLGDCSQAGYEIVVPRPAAAPRDVDVSVVFRSRDGRIRHYPGVKVRWAGDSEAIQAARP